MSMDLQDGDNSRQLFWKEKIMSRINPIVPLFAILVAVSANSAEIPGLQTDQPEKKAVAHSTVPITAEFRITSTSSSDSSKSQEGRYYRSSAGKIREDLGPISVITDPSAGTITTLNHQLKTKRVRSMLAAPTRPSVPLPFWNAATAEQQTPARQQDPERQYSVVNAPGEDKLEGHIVNKLIVSPPNQTSGQARRVEVWMAPDLRLQVFSQVKGQDNTTSKTFRNIVVTEPNPNLFLVTDDYTLVNTTQLTLRGISSK